MGWGGGVTQILTDRFISCCGKLRLMQHSIQQNFLKVSYQRGGGGSTLNHFKLLVGAGIPRL